MIILFLCGSLEPGRDGVGDYTRLLAGEMIRQGHRVTAVAINDWYISEKFTGYQKAGETDLPVLRVPSACKTSMRINLVKEWIIEHNPEWLSLQYVPYSFNTRGLHFGLRRMLQNIGKQRHWHVMMHELWIGKGDHFNLNKQVTSILQKQMIKQLIRSLRPASIHTQLPLNRTRLESFGLKIHSLPLFSNITVAGGMPSTTCSSILRIAFFSQVDINEAIIDFLKQLKIKAAKCGMEIEVVLIGRVNEMVQEVAGRIENIEGFARKVKITGFLQAEALSFVLQTCVLGVTPVPRHALGKSGTVAAFIEHGVPVAAPIHDLRYKNCNNGFFSPGLISAILLQPDLESLALSKLAVQRAKHEIELSAVAKTFIADLENA